LRSAQGHSEQRAGRSAAGGGQGSRERVDAGGWRHVGEGAKVDERGEKQPPHADAAAMELEVAGLDSAADGPDTGSSRAAAHRGLVVAVAAGEHLLAARRHDLTPPPVMLAPG